MVRAFNLQSGGRGFDSRNDLVVHTHVPLSPSSVSLVLVKGRRCSAAGKVVAGLAESNGSLTSGL